ncbi:MAG: lipopolysaccharide transport periplasmic protein LptA [Acidihalobacter sp.]|jgi:lipopolysaccharide export system protein LptA
MPNDRISRRLLLTAALLCVAPLPAVAQTPAASKAPVHISADHFRFDQHKGTGNYNGNVVVTQDKLLIKGNKLDILAPNNGPIQKLTMTGTPATFEDTTADDKHITGRAKNMIYSPAEQRIVLTGDAQLQQRGNTFRASRIVYDIRRDLVDAGAPGQRIEATFTPATGQAKGTPKQ